MILHYSSNAAATPPPSLLGGANDSALAIAYEFWRGPKDILVGQDRAAEIQRALEKADFGLLLISPAYLQASGDTTRLESFVAPGGKPIVPVMLSPVAESANLYGLDAHRIFRLEPKAGNAAAKSFGECSSREEKERFALKLFEAIEKRLLEAWALDPEGEPYFAVLGEYGIGKTTTLKQLTHRLLQRRRTAGYQQDGNDQRDGAAAPAFVPLPIFIDLRTYSETIREGRVPTLDTLLREIFERSWQVPEAPPFTPEDLKRLVREEGALVIFDGLDEKLVHLDEYQARQFLRELWSILPPARFGRWRKRAADARLDEDEAALHQSVPTGSGKSVPTVATAGRPGRMILSCRSHYFKTLREQNAMLTGGHATGVKSDDYRACILLPFAEPQVREYLAADENVGPDRVEAVLELFASVHNLTDLSRRPFLLSLITRQIERLEQRRARGEPVQGVTLYEEVVDEWLNRDDGKHRLDPEDKRRLMEDIAAEMWRAGVRQWSWQQVDRWLAARWAEDATFRLRYAPAAGADLKTFALLEEDFRTATFVLRPDTSADEFRFAHTSLQEYFLARYLWQAG